MKYQYWSICIFWIYIPVVLLGQTPSATEQANQILYHTYTTSQAAGMAAGIWYNGQIVWQAGVGFRDVKHQIAADSNMLHRIASIAKPMTAVAMMQLVEQGLLNLDKPIQEYLPTFPIKPKGTITVRHLLNHSAGIRAYKNGKEGFPTKHYPTLQDALRIFREDALVFEPRKGYQYSTYNDVVLGAILESLTGQSLSVRKG